MPTLDWIGKQAVVDHHREVPYRLLKCDRKKSVGDPEAENLLVQGDNLLALKALLPYYAGKVKCIYIDPPYNTGNEGWVYNDNVNSPQIREWLGKTVGKEAEDLSRHDKWLCMMYPRLTLLREFLSEDGVIFISIDDNEVPALRLILADIFGTANFVATMIWQKMFSPKNSAKYLSEDHDYIVIFAKSKDIWRPRLLPRSEETLSRYTNPDADPRGPWVAGDLCARNYYSKGNYQVTSPSGNTFKNPTGTYWRVAKEKFRTLEEDGRIVWGSDGEGRPTLKRFLSEVREGVVPQTLLFHKDVGHTAEAKRELLKTVAFDRSEDVFITPKPVRLIDRILKIASAPDSLILDSFAGSGTTMHAVMQLNREDGGNRRCIMIEMEADIAKNVTAKRITKVMDQDDARDDEGFRYCTLGQPLFDADGQINEPVTFSDLAHHVFFTETGTPIPKRPRKNCPLIGTHNGVAYYLLFNGILGDKSPNGGNVLTRAILGECDPPEGCEKRIIYGEACRLHDSTLKRESITFKQLPYEVEVN